MDVTTALFLAQDGVINGAIYALLGVALVLVFTVTRVILLPQGEFVAYGALTMAALEAGIVPGTAALLVAFGVLAAALDLARGRVGASHLLRSAALDIGAPLALYAICVVLAPLKPPLVVQAALTLALVAPMGPLLYRIAFEPLAEKSVLVLLIASVGVHLGLTGLGLLFFGAEGFRTTAFSDAALELGPLAFSGQSLWVLALTVLTLAALSGFFGFTMLGKALRASAVNRAGARLVGIPVALSGQVAFALAALIGALSGVLIAPVTTIYYDTGFIIGLKGFVAAIFGGLASFPLAAGAALLVGLVESFASFWASAFKEVIVFTIIIPVLLARSWRADPIEDEA